MYNRIVIYPINNDSMKVLQIVVRDNHHFKSEPQLESFDVEVQQFLPEGRNSIYIKGNDIDKIKDALEFILQCSQYDFHNPVTECCGERLSRNHIIAEEGHWCKAGYGCRREEECQTQN